MHPSPIRAVNERNEAAGIGQSTARSSGVETSLILGGSLQSGSRGQCMIASGGNLEIADSSDASGTDGHQISTLSVATQKGNVLLSLDMPASTSQQQSPGAAELVVATHARAMSAVMDMVTVEAEGLSAAASRADRNIGAALFRRKNRKAQMRGDPQAEGRSGQKSEGRRQVGGKGCFWACYTRERKEAGPKHPLKKSYRSYFRRAQIRWVIWWSSKF